MNIPSRYDETSLIIAAENGHLKVCKLLIDAVASVSQKNNEGMSSMHWAVYNGHVKVCKLLIDAGASVSNKDKEGMSSMHLAAYSRHTEICKRLIQHDTDINEKGNDRGKTPLQWAELASHRGADVHDITEEEDFTSFIMAAQNGHLTVC